MTIYISGPITGRENYKAAFAKAREKLESAGTTVIDPTRHPEGLTKGQYMRYGFADIDAADGVLMLDGWPNSSGASMEHQYAQYTGKRVFYGIKTILEGR